MPELLHISDLHFGPHFLPDRAEAVHALAARRRPDAVVVSGDLTQRAKRRQFAAARQWLAEFEAELVVTPGNHDVPLYRVLERIVAPYRQYRDHISDRLDAVHRVDGMTIVSLNSTRRLSITNGRLGRDQLEFAARAFRAAPEADLRAVVTHHHLAPPPDFARDRVMPGAKRALARFRDLGVQLLLAGHMHRAYIGDSLDFFPGGNREDGMVIVQCGTTTSARGRGRERLANSLNYIRATREEIFVSHWLWREEAGRFSVHSEHRFGVRPGIWLESGAHPGRARAAAGAGGSREGAER